MQAARTPSNRAAKKPLPRARRLPDRRPPLRRNPPVISRPKRWRSVMRCDHLSEEHRPRPRKPGALRRLEHRPAKPPRRPRGAPHLPRLRAPPPPRTFQERPLHRSAHPTKPRHRAQRGRNLQRGRENLNAKPCSATAMNYQGHCAPTSSKLSPSHRRKADGNLPRALVEDATTFSAPPLHHSPPGSTMGMSMPFSSSGACLSTATWQRFAQIETICNWVAKDAHLRDLAINLHAGAEITRERSPSASTHTKDTPSHHLPCRFVAKGGRPLTQKKLSGSDLLAAPSDRPGDAIRSRVAQPRRPAADGLTARGAERLVELVSSDLSIEFDTRLTQTEDLDSTERFMRRLRCGT